MLCSHCLATSYFGFTYGLNSNWLTVVSPNHVCSGGSLAEPFTSSGGSFIEPFTFSSGGSLVEPFASVAAYLTLILPTSNVSFYEVVITTVPNCLEPICRHCRILLASSYCFALLFSDTAVSRSPGTRGVSHIAVGATALALLQFTPVVL